MTERDLLLALLDQAYDRRSWHGTNLRGSLRTVDLDTAAWRPQPGRHNVWEIAVHCAYWKYAVWRRLTGAGRGSFSLRGSDWFERPAAATAAAWREDLRLLDQWHSDLHEAVGACPPRTLDRPTPSSRFTLRELVTGAAAHDLYHAGQIQLLKRLHAAAEDSEAAP